MYKEAVANLKEQKGFTLIELLIVVAIIGILAAIAIPAYMGFTSKTKVSGAVTQAGAIKSAVETYAADRGSAAACTSIGDINIIYGVTVSTQYVSDANVTALTTGNGGVITIVVANTGINDADSTTVVGTPVRDTATTGQIIGWGWGGNLPNKYRTSAIQ